MIKSYFNFSRRSRKAIFLVLILLGASGSITFLFTGFRPFLYAAIILSGLAAVTVLVSNDSKEWFKVGDMFLRFSLWSRKHPVLLALIVTAQPAIVVSVYFLLISRDIRKFVITISVCILIFIVSSVYAVVLANRLEKSDG